MITVHDKPHSFFEQFTRRDGNSEVTHYCPGCGHGVLHKLIAEAIDDLGIQDRTILVSPVGCSVFAYDYFDVGNVQAAHGRASAVATGIKRSRPGSLVISYQGDGDLASIGTAEILHAANRGENITVFFVNNAIYGMTGGQMAPTTLIGQKTTTTPMGRTSTGEGFPLKICELLATLQGVAYLERVALTGPRLHMKARSAVRKALQCQIDGRGFALVEVLSACPTGWKMTATEAWKWIEREMLPAFPLGVYRDMTKAPVDRGNGVRADASSEVGLDQVLQRLDVSSECTPDAVARHDFLRQDPFSLRIAGFGGQGVLSLGVIIATAGMQQGYQTSWLPSYGPEMRGGTANCSIVLSNAPIGSPLADHPDVLVAMNGPSLELFHKELAPGGLIFYDSSIISKLPANLPKEAIAIPASQIAYELGERKAANMVLLGALSKKRPIVSLESIHVSLQQSMGSESLLQLNRKALTLGSSWMNRSKALDRVARVV